jgi:hypothetical protein
LTKKKKRKEKRKGYVREVYVIDFLIVGVVVAWIEGQKQVI